METNASFWEAVRGAAASLHSSKLRSFLTLLGIILATTTLIAVMAVINGMNHYIAENVSDMGANFHRFKIWVAAQRITIHRPWGRRPATPLHRWRKSAPR